MARKRKNDMKSSVKSTVKYVPVRKSSRQIAKKQLEEKKVNGDVLQISSYPGEAEDGRSNSEYQNQPVPKKNQHSSRKHNKHKNVSNSIIVNNEECSYSMTSEYKKDPSESDSQDGIDGKSNKAVPEVVPQVVKHFIGSTNKGESEEVEVWPGDVIEETVICEEVDDKQFKDHSYASKDEDDDDDDEDDVVVKEIEFSNSPLKMKNLVDYSVIQNEVGMESDSRDAPDDECSSHKTKIDNSVSALRRDVPIASDDVGENILGNFNHSENEINGRKSSDKDRYTNTTSKDDVFNKINDELADMQMSQPSKEIQNLVNDLSNMESVMSPLQIACNTEKVIPPISVDDESSCSILDKMEQLHQTNSSSLTESSKSDCSTKSNVSSDKKNRKIANEDSYGDNEVDSKNDPEDTKVCSSSENSNDMFPSINNCKITEFDTKSNNISSSDVEKKVEFRSRSGSTDTTGSESGSNSSGVRRSSRIRSIGLMKQRSRGRGLVMKPNLDILKSTAQQEREKANNAAPIAQEVKAENPPDSGGQQSDKESNVKTANAFDLSSYCAGCTGYDSDSSKPVKVKSRWRRSSELEMGSAASIEASIGCIIAAAAKMTSTVPLSAMLKSSTSLAADVHSSDSTSASLSNNCQDTEQAKETSLPSNNECTVQIPKTVGARISLPMVLELKDREMEERLSQFELLRENLYLTERYTNKETKRMVCDCFLTEEEIERGELGCGEDCLNRLLMIECGPRCVVGDRCTNKRFQNCEYAKCEVFRTEKKGFGLRATVDMDAGEFIMEYVGEVVDPKDFRRRAKEYSKDKNKHYYFMALKNDQIIDATMKGNISRFINHSCDPNSETQKWTVNGELRIGFFNKKFITAGEEITFDYHFQRYGKEAQRCFCEALNCRGWIGETPEEEMEKIEKKEKREKEEESKPQNEKKQQADYMEDEDLEEEINKLCSAGLKNRAHTLTLSRLMVRSRELEHRTRLLRLIQSGEQPCRRLFLDYHGLRLIWSYVMDISKDDSEEARQFRLEVLKTLYKLPIPNKTMLMDSKIYNVVQKWSRQSYFAPSEESPEDDQGKLKPSTDDNEDKKSYQLSDLDKRELDIGDAKSDVQNLIPELASSLLAEWSNLKEVFRIPKKERIEQMKEHEREADRGYREELEKEDKRSTSYDRYRSDRFGRSETEKRDRRRRGDSPESDHSRSKDKRVEERSSLVPIPRMTKYERRQLFAMKVAKEEEERQRRQQQESWQDHENRCLALGIDPHSTAMVDPQTGYPVFYNTSIGQWQQYPAQDGEMTQQCTPVYVSGQTQGSHVLSSEIPSGVPPVVYTPNQTPVFNQTTPGYSMMSHCQYSESQIAGTSSAALQGELYEQDKQTEQQYKQPEIPPIDLPPKWKSATDARGRRYYYHVKERIPQWLPPAPDHIGVQPDSSSTSESSDESSSSNDEDEEIDEESNEEPKSEDMNSDNSSVDKPLEGTKRNAVKKAADKSLVGGSTLFPENKKRREGLVQERIISPRREEDRVDHKAHKGIKEKLRRQKERAKFKEHVDKVRRHRRSSKSKSHSRHLNKLQLSSGDLSTMSERKIKDMFRINMANVMVHFLNPYRKNDCKQGRITNTEDFKHLARKLTHFVLAKELKHCKSVDELQCNENVKHKAKDFVRKYMSKFGAVYQKGTDED
ncbi:probable histone-lysine N-methyltransferase CG1716 [Ceratina calcarata]|uniref:[histone H3]-lysine(36) N-trimethyltransferase n=1 Tax=Ceratina calcarata TaxID=156304 RepID=A0AAJ7JAQ0_9HYME|nr:probable histone-lysine N-methyltransferase CG1716 [Ceratina calcarata]